MFVLYSVSLYVRRYVSIRDIKSVETLVAVQLAYRYLFFFTRTTKNAIYTQKNHHGGKTNDGCYT